MKSGRGIYKDFDPTTRKSINTGYIIIPDNIDRGKFIEQCLRKERFSILVEGGGGFLHNCYITKSALRDISFPKHNERLGSAVVFFTEPFGGKAVITGVVSKDDQTSINKEEILVFKKTKDGNYALISVDGNGQVNIDVIGTRGTGKLNINVRNDSYDAEVNLKVRGKINLYYEGDTTLKVVGGDVNLISSKDVNITANRDVTLSSTKNVNVKSDKLMVHGASESMIKGDTLYDELIKTNDVLQSILQVLLGVPVAEAGNGAPSSLQGVLAQNLIGKVVGDFSQIKSEKSYLE